MNAEMLRTDAVVSIRDAVAAALRGCEYLDGSFEVVKVGRRKMKRPTSRPVTVCARGMYVEFSVRSRFRFGGDDYSAQIHLHYGGRAIAPRAPRSFATEFEWQMFERVDHECVRALSSMVEPSAVDRRGDAESGTGTPVSALVGDPSERVGAGSSPAGSTVQAGAS